MALRKVVTRSGRGFRGYFPSRKMGQMVAWESLLERDAIQLFEFSPGVLRYRGHQELVLYPDGSRIRRYFPDFEITTAGELTFHIEVKLSSKLTLPKYADKYRAIAAHYQSQARHFRIITELELRREPLFSNLERLARHSRLSEGHAAALSHISTLLRPGPLPLGALEMDEATLWRLLAQGQLRCDLAAPITSSTLISLPGGHGNEALYF